MDDVLVGFVQMLRAAGLRVSSSEALDAFLAVQHAGLRDRRTMKAALRAALVKRQQDIPLFDELFDRYFSPNAEPLPFPGPGDEGQQGPSGRLKPHEEFMRQLQQAMERLGLPPLDRLTEALLAGNVTVITAEMLQHLTPEQLQQLENLLQRGQITRYVLDQMGWQRIQAQLIQLARALQQAGEFELAQQVRERLWELQELFPRWVAQQVHEAYNRMAPPRERQAALSKTLMDKEFTRFTEDEVRAMEEVVNQLAQKLREDVARRMRRGGTRRLDVTRTLRASYKTAGVPMELIFKERQRNKLRLVVLCDVSSSVRNASRFMLQLVYSLQQQRGHVRSFVFIADVDEVTEFFERNSLEAAVEMATGEANIRYWAHSDFGRVFRQFLDEYGDALNKRTTVIVLGDGRSNFFDPQVEALAEIRSRARRLIWLNPESQWAWGTGDSIIDLYAPECDLLVECRNLRQLAQVMEYLTKLV